ncbi:MAG TPA: hypothetical protein VJY15_11365 [Candidatus Acidoferrum sp.]|nr:hypothetical protein [Candidatus Acidoferrum sp.]
MPGRLKCNSCGGTWPDPKVTGLIYMHQCPPQIVQTPEVADAVTHVITVPAVFQATPNPRNELLQPNTVFTPNPQIISAGSGVTVV